MLNNELNAILNKEYPHDFSICDIDGAVRHDTPGAKSRLIIFESKHFNEPVREHQGKTLRIIWQSIKWEQFDSESGLFIIRTIDPISKEGPVEVYRLTDQGEEIFKRCFIDDLYQVFSGKKTWAEV